MNYIGKLEGSLSYAGDDEREEEFTRVYEKYVNDIYRLCFSFMKNQMDAEDAVQETLKKSAENMTETKASGTPGTGKTDGALQNTSAKERKYIRITADFGEEYTTEDTDEWGYYYYEGDSDEKHVEKKFTKIAEGSNGTYNYRHKSGFAAGKDFYYDVLYVDTEEHSRFTLYDQDSMKEVTINGHKAFVCVANGLKGTRYRTEEKTSYAIHVFLFYDEYGYIIDLHGMDGLDEKGMISLAEKIKVEESDKEHASRYEYFSNYWLYNDDYDVEDDTEKEDITVHPVSDIVEYGGFTYQVKEVKVSDQLPKVNRKNFNWECLELDPKEYLESNPASALPFKKESVLWKKDGSLKSYLREQVKTGDGISEAERSVTDTERVQLKAVSVTMKVKADKKSDLAWCFQAPSMSFFEKQDGQYKDVFDFYEDEEHYNRPKLVRWIRTDGSPCYFKESSGGKGFLLKDIEKGELKRGEEVTYHFTYVVDEDMVDKICLELGQGYYSGQRVFVDLEAK